MPFIIVHRDTKKTMEIVNDVNDDLFDILAIQIRVLIITRLNKGDTVIVKSQAEIDMIKNFFSPTAQDALVAKEENDDFCIYFDPRWFTPQFSELNPFNPSSPPPP